MNIQSISELTLLSNYNAEALQQLTARLDTIANASVDFAPIADAIHSESTLGNILANEKFDVLSCEDFYVEASYNNGTNYKSLKFNLGEALSRLAKSIALVAIRNLNALTKETADEIYVPYEGNLGSSKAVSGLWVTTVGTRNATALSVNGPVQIHNEDNSEFVNINPNSTIDNSTFEIKAGLLDASDTNASHFSELTATKISASTELSAKQLCANTLCAGYYTVTNAAGIIQKFWNIIQKENETTCKVNGTITASVGNFADLTASNLTVNNLTVVTSLNAIQNPTPEDIEPTYNLIAGFDDSHNAIIGTTNLTATSFNCTGNIECVGTINAGGAITCVGGFSCNAGDGDGNKGNINCAGSIACGSALDVEGDIACGGKFTGAGNIELTGSGNNISCTGGLTCQGPLSAVGNINCSGGISAGGNLELTGANHSIKCTAGISAGGNLELTGANHSIKCTGGISAGGNFALTGANNTISCTGNLSSSGDVVVQKTISCVTNISCSGNLRANGNLCACYTDDNTPNIHVTTEANGNAKIKNLSSNIVTCRKHLYVGASESYNLDVPDTGKITVGKLQATDLTAGVSTSPAFTVLKAEHTANMLTLNALNVTASNGLSAAGISELTAKAACWS